MNRGHSRTHIHSKGHMELFWAVSHLLPSSWCVCIIRGPGHVTAPILILPFSFLDYAAGGVTQTLAF